LSHESDIDKGINKLKSKVGDIAKDVANVEPDTKDD
jgi:hypothetical protein